MATALPCHTPLSAVSHCRGASFFPFFIVTRGLSPNNKALLLSALLLIDYMYYETKKNNNNN